LPEAAPLDDANRQWIAAYCKPRQEKALAWDLCHKRVPYFLPMVKRETSSGGRRRRNLYPMFKSYLFVAADENSKLASLKTQRVVTFVDIHEAQQPDFRREIASLELGLRAMPDSIQLYPRLVKGAWVRVTSGPMTGAEGIVLDAADDVTANSQAKLLLGVTFMNTGATIEIHPDMVEPYCREPATRPRNSVTVAYDLEHRNPKPRTTKKAALAARP